jgi:fatty acid desaturase
MSTVAEMSTTTAPQVEEKPKLRVKWYRSPVPREELSKLNKRSDFWGFLQTGGYLGLLALTAAVSIYSAYHWPWYATVAIVYFHGACWNFMVNGFHELIHDSVFKTKWLNSLFLHVFSFLGWYNPHYFWASHMEHHKYTLHAPDDLEVVLPQQMTIRGFLKTAFISPMGLWWTLKGTLSTARGIIEGKWIEHLFPPTKAKERRQLINWARLLLVGHALIFAVSIYMGWWMLPLVTSLAPFYGGGLHTLCNASQHIGLVDKTPDYRLCCRTIYLNPFVQFLYWHMNYHTEHHMYAAVPCYNLPRLHRLIKHDMPECPNGLIATWYQIGSIIWRQRLEPDYQYEPKLPSPARRAEGTATPVATRAQIGADEAFDDNEDDHHDHH